jgi:hypothetical protein
MKKLNKLVLKNAKIMTAPQMKHIAGGYNESGKKHICCRYEDKPGCHTEFYDDTCDGHAERCGGRFYTCS